MSAPRIPTVAVCACLRNSAEYLDYFRAVLSHQIGVGREFNLIFSLVEGDSSDDTAARLQAWAAEDPRLTLTHRNIEPLIDFDDRVRKWAELGNLTIAGLEGREYDYMLWCDSDLCIPADLVKMLLASGQDVVAPAFFLGGMFYDTWGFRGQDGQRFHNHHPIHPSYRPFELFPINSAGGVVMFRRAVLDAGIRFRGVYEDGLLVGFCNDARAKGFGVFCDSRISVVHPTSLWRHGLYTLGAVELHGPASLSESVASGMRQLVQQMLAHPSNPMCLGQPNVPAEHPTCQSINATLQQHFPEWQCKASLQLHSEGPKRFKVCCELSPAAPQAAAGTIVIDGVFFQRFQTGIARVWRSLLQQWAGTAFGERLLVLDRVGTAPRIPGLRYLDMPAHDYADLAGDRRRLQQVCDEQGAVLFISTYYSAPERTPTVFMAHDMIPELLAPETLGHPMWAEKHAGIRQARRFIAVSHNTAADLRRLFPEVAAERISVAHCGVDFQPPAPTTVDAFRQAHGVQRPYFLLVGARGGYKNTLAFFKAFAALGAQRARYAIVCTGAATQLEPEYQPYVGEAQLHLLQLDDAGLQAAYGGALALVYPSRYEGFGMPVIEAMACGCPVITTSAGSLKEVAGEAALRVDPGDVPALGRALKQITKQAELRERLRAAGRQRAAQFSWAKMADGVRQVLEQEADHVAAQAVPSAETAASHVAAGDAHLAQGRGVEAYTSFQRALALDRNCAPARERLEALVKLVAARQPGQA